MGWNITSSISGVIRMPKVAIYTRVSTQFQIDGDSLEIQRQELINFSKYHLNCDDYVVFEDGGYSGGNTMRPKYQEMLLRMREGEFTHLLVWKIDRISRNILDFSDLYNELNTLNITFISKMEQFDTSTIMGQALLKIILIFAELERHFVSERVKAVLLSKSAEGGFTGFQIPFGYRRDPNTGEYSIEESEAIIIKKIFDLYEADISSSSIAKHLNLFPLEFRKRKNGLVHLLTV